MGFRDILSKLLHRRRVTDKNGAAVTSQDAASVSDKSDSTTLDGFGELSAEVPSPETLWDDAYDVLKANDPELVDKYERLVIRETEGDRRDLSDPGSTQKGIAQEDRARRRKQMAQVLERGLQRIDKESKAKRRVEETMAPISSLEGTVREAVKWSPEANLAWAGIYCIFQVLSNPVTETRSNRDGLAYVLSRMRWYNELSRQMFKGPMTGLQTELRTRLVDLYQAILSFQMRSICSYYKDRRVVFLRDLILLDNWADTLNAVKDMEAALQQDVNTHLNDSIISHLHSLATTAESLNQDLIFSFEKALHDQTLTLREMRSDDKNNECISSLLSASPLISNPWLDMDTIEQLKGGLLDELHAWILTHPDVERLRTADEHRLLWIKGGPGKGKTMLLIGLMKHLERSAYDQALAVFFCQDGTTKNNAVAVLRGLIYCLVKQRPGLVGHIREKYDDNKGIFEDVNALFVLQKVLQSMLCDPKLEQAYIVIDALDECESDRKWLVKFIATALELSPKVKWIVSSRNEPHIEDQLRAWNLNMQLHLDLSAKEVEHHVTQGVTAYIKERVLSLPGLDRDLDLKVRVESVMHSRAEGTFLWAHLAIQELYNVSTWSYLSVLDEMPPGLHGIFTTILRRIQSLPREDPTLCREILSAVALSYRPLTVSELPLLCDLPESIRGNPENLKRLLSMCGSLLHLQGDSLHFVHLSAKEYLTKNASSTIFPRGLLAAHHGMFSRSIQAMESHKGLRKNIYNLQSLAPLGGRIIAPSPNPLQPLRYSCVYWVDHFCDACPLEGQTSPDLKGDCDAVKDFLNQKFLHWFEAINLIGALSHALSSMEKMQALLQRLQKESALYALVNDIHRFARQFGTLIRDAPLQLYVSARLFTPAKSFAHQLFSNDCAPDWVFSRSLVNDNWSPLIKTIVPRFIRGKESISCVSISGNSKFVACGTSAGVVHIWDTGTGLLRCHPRSYHPGWVKCLAFSQDCTLLASACSRRTMKVIETTSGSLTQELELDADPIKSSMSVSNDSSLLVLAVDSNKIMVYKTDEWTLAANFPGQFAVFSEDSRHLAVACCDEDSIGIQIWTTNNWSRIPTFQHNVKSSRANFGPMVFCHGSDVLAATNTHNDESLELWRLTEGLQSRWVLGRESDYHWLKSQICLSPDGGILACGLRNGRIEIWELPSGELKHVLQGHRLSIDSLSFSKFGLLVSTSSDKTVRIWDTSISTRDKLEDDRCGSLLLLSPNNKLLAAAHGFGTVWILDAVDGSLKETLPNLDVQGAAFSPDSTLFAVITSDGYLYIYDTRTWSYEKVEATDLSRIPADCTLVFSRDSRLLATAGTGLESRIWDVRTGVLKHDTQLQAHAATFSSDGQLLALTDEENLHLLNMADSEPLNTRKTTKCMGDKRATALALSQGARFLALSVEGPAFGSTDSHIFIWDIPGERAVLGFRALGIVDAMAFDTDNAYLQTNVGRFTLDLNLNLDVDVDVDEDMPPRAISTSAPCNGPLVRYIGYAFSADLNWIEWEGEKVVWIPPEYRLTRKKIFTVGQDEQSVIFAFQGQVEGVLVLRLAASGVGTGGGLL
ncbi:uncharacterized protein DSM5745_06808 [Aspergillus mulundensis]|uniref:NACHT domain-containing protein n=1 Tax=Aspergillus mulundensis TaxID=1810919 RepID=A0A3D8RS91_9EURO|nr:hypothetical protein DSM5745_06808 [Aspergillus mulundensis]RDW76816.1 hypothetical protein DSM5745_06808 [Aspergillus mulundensis]